MTRPRAQFSLNALLVAYIALAAVAPACGAPMTQTDIAGHHHHHTVPAHSTLCAWLCQVTSHVPLAAAPPMLATLIIAERVVGWRSSRSLRAILHRRPSRGPPRFRLLGTPALFQA
jgi:hypothetical protein